MAMSVHGLVSAYRTITNGNSEKRMVCITYVAAVHCAYPAMLLV